MTITYYIDDGFAGADRPQHVHIDDDEIKECDNFEEVKKLVWDAIENDFPQKVHPIWDDADDRSELENVRFGLNEDDE